MRFRSVTAWKNRSQKAFTHKEFLLAFLGEHHVYMSDFNFEVYFSISVIEANGKFVKKNVIDSQKFVN